MFKRFIAAAVTVAAGFAAAHPAAAVSCPAVVAHRGLHYPYSAMPENSPGAADRAHAAGVPAVETDIRFSRDNVPMIMHDATVDRVTNYTGHVWDWKAWRLARMTLAEVPWGTATTSQHIPSLYQMMARAHADGLRIIVEAKATRLSWAQAQAIADRFRWLGAWDWAHVHSFFPYDLALLRKADSRFTGHTELLSWTPVADGAGDVLEDVGYANLTAAAVASLHAAGLAVGAWTPGDPAGWAAVTAAGVDQITSDNAAGLRSWETAHC